MVVLVFQRLFVAALFSLWETNVSLEFCRTVKFITFAGNYKMGIMRKIVCFCVFLLVSCMGNVLDAQLLNYPVQTIDGVQYYIYTVEKSEGLFRISKKFDVSQNDIKEANPEIKGGLKLGQVLRIPVKKEKTSPLLNDSNIIVHVIAPKETLYGLSRQYGVSMDELVRYNPELTKNMPIGGKLLIPVGKQVVAASRPVSKDTLPVVQEEQGQKIQTAATVTHSDTLSQPVRMFVDSLQTPAIRIAYLLPFMLDAVEFDPAVDKFVEFYEGALLAVNDAKNKGIRLEINTYDTEKNEIRIQTILARPEMKTMDLIIGPAYPAQVKYISDFAFDNKINTLIPFASEIADISINPYLFQFNPTTDMELETILMAISRKKADLSVLYVKFPNAPVLGTSVDLQSIFQKSGIDCKEMEWNKENADTIQSFLSEDKRNILIFNTDRINIVRETFSVLSKLKEHFHIEIVGQYAWLSYPEEIPVPMYYTSLFLPEPDKTLYAVYEKQFNRFYGHDLLNRYPRYDLLGYDLTAYFIDLMAQYGAMGMRQHGSSQPQRGLIISPLFMQQNELCGFVNKRIYLLRKDAKGMQIIK